MKITLEVKEGMGSSTIWLNTSGLENDINLHSVISKDEIDVIKTMLLKIFSNTPKQETKPFDNSQNINKVFKKSPTQDLEIIPEENSKFKVGNYVRVIEKSNKMYTYIGKVTKIKNSMYNVEFEPNFALTFDEKDLDLVDHLLDAKVGDFVKYINKDDKGIGIITYIDRKNVKIDNGFKQFYCDLFKILPLDKTKNIVQIKNNKSFKMSGRYGIKISDLDVIFKEGYHKINFGDCILEYHKRNFDSVKKETI